MRFRAECLAKCLKVAGSASARASNWALCSSVRVKRAGAA